MTATIEAPYPNLKVTSYLPDPQEDDSRGTQSDIQVVRGATSKNIWTYAKTSDKVNLSATWVLTRAKDDELDEFIRVYHTAKWRLTFNHEVDKDTQEPIVKIWVVQLVGEPIRRNTFDRQDDDNQKTGIEVVQVTLNFSAEDIS